MKKILLLLLIFTYVTGSAQDIKQVKQLFQEAEGHLLYEEYDLALPKYKKLIKIGWDNANTNFSIGICYLNMHNQIDMAIPFLEKAASDVSQSYKEGNYKEEKAPEEAYFYLAKAYRLAKQYDKAKETYKTYRSGLSPMDVYYLNFVDLQIKNCEQAEKMIKSPIPITKTEPPFVVNEECYNPVISGDGNSVVFTSLQQEIDSYTGERLWFEIVYHSQKTNDEWSTPKDISSELASDGYFSTTGLNGVGDYMILYRDDYGNGNLYFSIFNGGTWTKIEKLPKQISSRSNETHGSLSKDGNTMYFISDREGGIGAKDIYKVDRIGGRNWGEPINLGDVINTPFEEETPFISADGKTLYFASEAHTSMGGYDIFKSTLGEDGKWSQPQNLGYPINTGGDDLFYQPVNDDYAYMSRKSETEGLWRIYTIEKAKGSTPEPIVEDDLYAKDPVVDDEQAIVGAASVEEPKEELPQEYDLQGVLSLQDNSLLNSSFYVHVAKQDGEVIASLSPDIGTGEFRTILNPGSYKLTAYGDGYQPASQSVVINEGQQNQNVVSFLSMVPIQVSTGEYYSIKNVFFDYNSSDLNREAQEELERLAVLMDKNPSLYIEVAGNTDSHGSEEYNKNLSMMRARSVVNYINNKGIESSRFVTRGLGTENYIAINQNPDGSDNPKGRSLNRRAEMRIVKSNTDEIKVENIFVPDELRYKDQLTYTILLMETKTPLKSNYFSQSGENINNVWMFQTHAGYLYTVGQFKEKADALPVMNMVVDAGFPDAKVISSLEYNELVQKSSRFYKSKMNDSDKTVYTIQLSALAKPVKEGYFKGIKDVEQVHGSDGYYRYIWGEYIGKTSARQALDQAIENGYYDAFIVSMSKFRE